MQLSFVNTIACFATTTPIINIGTNHNWYPATGYYEIWASKGGILGTENAKWESSFGPWYAIMRPGFDLYWSNKK